ncbi:ABC transporter substrate-binding protein [Kocuria varians]|uniref:Endolytic murein transglycosylase n=1 Tax=Kocuria varians TaxID=1272 RepID=A0A4Y4D700_KOCVA|nr:endolytic transglycosylase MltG [Kocuria varians]GEC98550.1 ABC transporter substrate-binding protein [Kocuria varians]
MSDEPRGNGTGGGASDHWRHREDRSSATSHDGDAASTLAGSFVHHDVTPEQRKRRKLRSRASLATAVALFVAALLVVVAVLGSAFGLFERKDYHGSGDKDVSFSVEDGSTTGQIAEELQSQEIVANASYFVKTFQKRYPEDFIQPGTYQLKTHMPADDVVSALMERDEANHYAAIAKTQRMDDTFTTLSQSTGIAKTDFEKLSKDKEKFGIPDKFPNLEGWLHPGEYRFPLDATAEQILQEMVDRTKDTLKKNDVPEDKWFEVLTIGSIVEFEGTPKIYPSVAGAIENRINNPDGETSGFIQSDASVTYGLGKKTVHLTDEEKKDKSNPYNTYANPGLPVGPIGSPSDEAIAAAAKPEKNDYYYWVTVNLDTGETKFAKTYEEHQKYVEQYQKWCSDNDGKCS